MIHKADIKTLLTVIKDKLFAETSMLGQVKHNFTFQSLVSIFLGQSQLSFKEKVIELSC